MAIPKSKIDKVRDAVFDAAFAEGRPLLAAIIRTAARRNFAGDGTLGGLVEKPRFFNTGELALLSNSLFRTRVISEIIARAHLRARFLGIKVIWAAGDMENAAANLNPGKAFKIPPARALKYFQQLKPGAAVPVDWLKNHRRMSFKLAAMSDETLVTRVHTQIHRAMATGINDFRSFKTWFEGEVKQGFDDGMVSALGASKVHPQYAEMVYRTNAMDSYNDGYWNEVAEDKDMQDFFPLWEYLLVDDGRLGDDHAPNASGGIGGTAYYDKSESFDDVRGGRVFNCRCTFRWVDKYEAEDLGLHELEKLPPPPPIPPAVPSPGVPVPSGSKIAKETQRLRDQLEKAKAKNEALKAKVGVEKESLKKQRARLKKAEDELSRIRKYEKGNPKWAKEQFKDFGEKLLPMERRSMGYYVGSGYEKINLTLRKGLRATGSAKIAIKEMDNVFKKIGSRIDRNVISYRGMSDPKIFGNLKKMKGRIIQEKSFTSTSFNEKTATSFAKRGGQKGILVEIKIPKGSKAIWTDSATGYKAGESELLINRKSKFRVIDVQARKGKPDIVKMELVA